MHRASPTVTFGMPLGKSGPGLARRVAVGTRQAFGFGTVALASTVLRLAHSGARVTAALAPFVFGAADLVILTFAVRTLWVLVEGKLLPAPTLQPAKVARSERNFDTSTLTRRMTT